MQTGEGERGERICPGQESRLAPPGSGVLQAKMLCNHSVHLGDLHIPPCSTAIEGGENGVAGALCSSRERCLPLLHQLLVHFGAWLRPQEPIIQPRALGIGWGRPLQPNALSCLGKHSHHLSISLRLQRSNWRCRFSRVIRFLMAPACPPMLQLTTHPLLEPRRRNQTLCLCRRSNNDD